MCFLRALAVIGIVIHHWLLFTPFEKTLAPFSAVAEVVKELGGTRVQLFFILSGCGLAVSYLTKGKSFSLREWVQRRFRKTVVPYWIIVGCTFVLANLSFYFAGKSAGSYSWLSLLAYLSFTRNHYEPCEGMNPSLWFMPVIIGLYALFPLLMKFLMKYGIGRFLILTSLITYASITLFEFSGYEIEHQNAIFLFYLLDFTMGMVIGYMWSNRPDSFAWLLGAKSFFLGIAFYGLSFAIIELWKHGDLYNDALTGAGLFLMGISLWNLVRLKLGERLESIVHEVSRVSYVMYLIHVPLILYIIRPSLERTTRVPFNPVISLGLSGVFAFVVFLLARVLYPPIMRITNIRAHSNTAHGS
jgi:peptidoglycan/LPS O-acetylase OafA/YrhL